MPGFRRITLWIFCLLVAVTAWLVTNAQHASSVYADGCPSGYTASKDESLLCINNSDPLKFYVLQNPASLILDSRCIGRARPLECQLAVSENKLDQYNDDVCFSEISTEDGKLIQTGINGQTVGTTYNVNDANGEPLYNSDTCKAKRGKADCDKKQSQGFVYTYVLGSNPETSCYSFTSVITVLMQYAMLIAAVICGFMFLWGGIKYTISKGNPAALMEARDQILHATIGLVIILMAYIIVLFLQGSLGFLGINLVGPFGYLGGT